MLPLVEVNYIAILIAAIASMIIGSLWYSVLFGKIWIKLLGITEKQIKEARKKGMGKTYTIAFIASLITAYVLSHFIDYVQAASISDGFTLGFWLWLGIAAPLMLGSVLWENKPFKLFVLTTAHELVSLMIMSAILAVWF